MNRRTASALGVAMMLGVGLLVAAVPMQPDARAEGVPRDRYALSLVADGIKQPHAIRTAPDGRLFLLQQSGKVRIVQGGRLLRKPALRMSDNELVALQNSAGLLSVAFPPGFATASTQYVYLLYTHTPTTAYPYRHNVVSRWQIDANVIDPGSEEILVHLDPLLTPDGGFATSHYGGDMEFGDDGKLYVTTGDLYTASNGQRLDNRLGKILRYNLDGSIPGDNPFYSTATGANRAIWDYGLRNPFKLAKDRKTGRMVLGDVGSTKFEELNVIEPGDGGRNYGWAVAEGYTTDPSLTSPILAYPHTSTTSSLFGCAVMGGDIYRPRQATFPRSKGDFFFADHCQGWLRTIDPDTGAVGQPLVTGLNSPVDMAVSRNGSVWILQRHMADGGLGGLLRLDYVGSAAAPTITTQPADTTAAIGGSATFSVYASGSQPLTYQWFRNGSAIAGATSSSLNVANVAAGDNGALFKVRVTNVIGSIDSRSARLTVSSNQQPQPTMTSPVVGATFAAGDLLHLAGTATDLEDGVLPAAAFEWDVDLYHNTHSHDIMTPVSGVRSLDVPLSRTDEVDTDIFYRVSLTVTDSAGASTVITRDVVPRLTSFDVDTEPTGLSVQLEGIGRATPFVADSVVGTTRTLNAAPVTVDGTTWVFDSWDDGVTTAARSFNASATQQSFLAFFRVSGGTVGTGQGLTATYYADKARTSPVLTRIDRTPYFDWPSEPVPGAPKDDYAVVWRGELLAQFTGTYTFSVHVNRDEELQLRVDDDVLINAKNRSGSVTGTTNLVAGVRYPIEIVFTDDNGGAEFKLRYARGQDRLAPIPGSQLYPAP